jgi:hypothetical protein
MEQKSIDNDLTDIKFISLHEQQRKRELERITMENQKLLEHIQETEPVYNRLDWEKECLRYENVRKNMTEFPDYYKPAYTPSVMMRRLQEHAAQATVSKHAAISPPKPPSVLLPPIEQGGQSYNNESSSSSARRNAQYKSADNF